MAEIVSGKIIGVSERGCVDIRVPYSNWERFCRREYDEVLVQFPDQRRATAKQITKAHALFGDIAEYTGYTHEQVELMLKKRFMLDFMQELETHMFHLNEVDVTTAKDFITFLVDFVIEFDIPTRKPLSEVCEDIQHYVYACATHKKCAVCGRSPCDLHHADAVGMGRDRRHINHIGIPCLPLCREHHMEAHRMGEGRFESKYHLETVPVDETIKKLYKLGSGKEYDEREQEV